jgi:hypothetical protein
MRRAFERPSTMHRSSLLIIAVASPLLAFACSNYTGQNLLETLPDGATRIPLYEAGPQMAFEGSFEASFDGESEGQAMDATPDSRSDAAEGGGDGGREASSDGPVDSPHEGGKG